MRIISFYACMLSIVIQTYIAARCLFDQLWWAGGIMLLGTILMFYVILWIDVRIAEGAPLDEPCILPAAQPGYISDHSPPDPTVIVPPTPLPVPSYR